MTLAQLFDLAFGNIGRFFKEIAFKKEERGKLSYGLVGTLILVLTYGLIMLFSASYSTGYYRFKGDIYHFIRPQAILAVVGLVLMYLISNINYRSLRHMNWYLYILTLLLLVWALFSEPYNGCYRWVYMFGTTLQPSELAKFSAILGLACFADRYYEKRGTLLYGIVRFVKGKPHLLHASSTAKKVIVDKDDLFEMLKLSRNVTGIRVVRLTDDSF